MCVKALASLLLQEYLNNYAIDVHFRQKILELQFEFFMLQSSAKKESQVVINGQLIETKQD
jgi:hypothetical protein